jgi:hypothetical protein
MDSESVAIAATKPSPDPAGNAVLSYALAARRIRFNRQEWIALASLGMLLLTTCLLLARATHDEDPYSDSALQAALYVGLSPLLILLWPGWGCYMVAQLARRRLGPAWGLLLVPSVLLGLGLSYVLYNVTIDYVQDARDLHGARWPVIEKVFSR